MSEIKITIQQIIKKYKKQNVDNCNAEYNSVFKLKTKND